MSHSSTAHSIVRILLIVAIVFVAIGNGLIVQPAYAAANLTVEIIAAPNLIVDSNVLSPSTAQPIVATVIGKFCNTGGSTLNNVVGYVGNYVNGTSDTPGVYPVNADPVIGPVGTQTDYRGNYSFTHLGAATDATRYIGALGPGECSNQYWSFTYPKTAINDFNGATIPAWGVSVKPDDDLWLEFDIWGNYPGQTPTPATHKMTMRNEISAMANKIEPNGNPGGRWFNTDTSTINPGETVTTNGILYRLGNINQGFDNNDDGVPDYNAWLQPFGDPAYDPNCFRLIETTGVVTVTTTSGDVIIPFKDNLYFTDLPQNNTNTVGLVYYKFLALGGACTIPITPYQEVASGSDNEKFNGDYGAGPAPVGSYEPQVTLSKSAPGTIAEATTFTYNIPFTNTSTTSTAGLTISSGGVDMPLVVEDMVPTRLNYVCGSAAAQTSLAAPNTATIYYSTDSGATWSTSEPASCPGTNPISTGPNSLIVLRWKLNNPLPRSPQPGSSGNTAGFQAIVPTGYINGGGNAFVENCAEGKFGTSSPAFAEGCAVTVVNGPNSLGDTVWRDDGAGGGISNNGLQDGTETGIANVTVTLYWDRNGDGILDKTDPRLNTTTSNGSGTYGFNNLPDGRYLVVVDTLDTDIPIGFGPTTRTKYAIDLDSAHASVGAVTNLTADFGFGPALSLTKVLLSNNPAYEGENATFRIDLRNNLPGDGTASGFCQYKIYAGVTPAADGTPSSGSGNAGFTNPANAVGTPNETLATSTMANNADTLGLSGFNFSGQTGQVTSVQLMVNLHEINNLQATQDVFEFRVYRNNLLAQTLAYNGTNLPGPAGTEYVLQPTLTSLWTLSDFTNNATELQIYANGNGTPANIGDIGVDAVAFIITTDQVCGGPDSTIATLPVTDTYDADLLGFVSANPAHTTQSTSGTAPNTNGTVTWANMGLLYAGQTKSITVTFAALEPGATTVNMINNVNVNGAIFANGRPVNPASASANVDIVPTGSITGVVYSDRGTIGWVGATGHETLGTTDFGIPGATVTLWGCYNVTTNLLITNPNTTYTCQANQQNGQWRVVTTTTTTSSGAYAFTGLREGYYYVQDAPPAWTGAAQSAEAGSSNTNQNGTGRICGTCDNVWGDTTQDLNTTNFNPIGTGGSSPNENITNVNFGYQTVPARIFGKVYEDNNGDGAQGSGERNISGVTVRLCSDATCTTVLQTTTTATDGSYGFSVASPSGNYYVQVNGGTPIAGTIQTDDPDNSGNCSSAGGCDNRTNALTVTAGQSSGSHDFGYQPSGSYSIGDTLYRDWNGDGVQGSGEEGLPNITVSLYEDEDNDGVRDPEDALIATAATNVNGVYTFSNLPNGNYLVVVDTADADFPPGHTQTGDPDGACPGAACDSRSTSAAISGANDLDNDFGYRPVGFGSIGDYVWYDSDADGVQDASEAAASNVTLRLYQDQDGDGVIDPEDALVGTDVTDASGLYSFDNLPAGNFIVQIDPAEFSGGGTLAGYTMTTEGTPYNTSQVSYAVPLGAGETFRDADFGFATTAVGDFIWQDNDGDGLADAGEPGINGVVMELYRDVNNNGAYDAGTDTLYGTTTTANNSLGVPGYYLFSGMPEGNYIVRVEPSNFTTGVLQNYTLTADPDVYNEVNPSSVSCLTTGAQGCDNLKPYDRYASTSPNDENPAIRAGTIELTADFGYQPRGVLGDTVWIDTDNDGVRDANEQGISDVTVWLCTTTPCGSGNAVRTAVTDENGEYSFGGLTNGQIYYVRVNTGDPDFPAGLTQTYGTAEQTRTINTGVNNGIDLTVDFGYRFSGTNTITGTAWNDADNGGQTGGTGDIDPAETVRYSNVPVYLWHCGADAVCGNGDDTLVGSTTTDASGQYSFPGLAAGTYRVVVNANAFSLRGTTATTTTDYDGTPASTPAVTFAGAGQTTQRDFGFLSSMDLGDLPDTYNNTLLADNGPRHTIGTLFLGSSTTADADGQESASATGDTDNGVARTPGIHWQVGANGASVDVTVSGCASTCYLGAWFDWNNDRDFNDSGERVLLDRAVSNGAQIITFDIPVGTTFPSTFNGRFRLYPSSTGGLAQPTGLTTNGEVEDYQWIFGPTAVTLNSMTARAEAGTPVALLIFILMGVGVVLLIAWAKRHRIA